MIATASVRNSRIIVEECIKWANQRRVFGKRLVEEPVIRQKCVTLCGSPYAFDIMTSC